MGVEPDAGGEGVGDIIESSSACIMETVWVDRVRSEG